MQHDLFEPELKSQLKELRERRQRAQASLEQINFEINATVVKGRARLIGQDLWLTRQPDGSFGVYTLKSDKIQLDFYCPVSVDLLKEAMKELLQENHNAPERVSTSNGSKITHSPW